MQSCLQHIIPAIYCNACIHNSKRNELIRLTPEICKNYNNEMKVFISEDKSSDPSRILIKALPTIAPLLY